jgi:hypothetical protein
VFTSFDTTAGDSSRASPPGASSFSTAQVVSEAYRTHEVDWIKRVETFHDAEGLGRVAIIVAIDFEETKPSLGPSGRPIQRERAVDMQHGALEIADEREGFAKQGDRITYDISATPAC